MSRVPETHDPAPEEPVDTAAGRSRHRPVSFFLARDPKIILSVLLIYLGIGVAFYSTLQPRSLSYLLERYGTVLVGSAIALSGAYLFLDVVRKRRLLREDRFVDVDARVRASPDAAVYERLLATVQRIEQREGFDSDRLLQALRTELINAVPQTAAPPPSTFVGYFESIRTLLEQKAAASDEKASILLDKGTSYSRWGIYFFVFSIAAWQLMARLTGFQTQYIFGIVSCSILFIFIEFLSAWFLRQYRQFVDTSTYLIKVKSLFDRYLLVYFAATEAITEGRDSRKATIQLIDLLRSDIPWPETYLTKTADVSFAKEALETIALLTRTIRDEARIPKERHRKQKSNGA